MRENIRSVLLSLLRYIIILFVAGIIGILLLTLAYCIPVNPETKESSLAYSSMMGWAPLVNNRYTQYESYFTSYEIGILDDTTDHIILEDCFDDGEEAAIVRATDMNNYGRYWHGYVAILRPIFYFIDYWDFLLVNGFGQLFVMGCVGYAVYKATRKKRYLLAFFCSCAFLTPMATAMSLQNSPVFYISMLGSLFCLCRTEWILEKQRRYYLFLILGILTCYFDFLTYPLLSFAFPFCWLMAAADEKLDSRSGWKLLFGGGTSFVIGWGGFFVIKWLVQAVILGPEILKQGLSAVFYRMEGSLEEELRLLHQTYNRIDTLYNNFRHYFFPLFILILLAWIVFFAYCFWRRDLQIKSQQLIYAAVTLTSVAWYLILNNHTSIHHLFTYRIYGASLLGFMLFVCGCMDDREDCGTSWKDYVKRGMVLALCFGVGLSATRLAKEDMVNLNGGEHTELSLAEGDQLEFEFTPSVGSIRSFGFCVKTDGSQDGVINIGLYDGENLCGEMTIPICVYTDTAFSWRYTEWNLQVGKTYCMRISSQDNDMGINLLVTPEGQKPQQEYGRAFLNGEQLPDIAPLSGMVYRGRLQTVPIKLFMAGCVAAFLLMWVLSIKVFAEKIKKI